MTKKDLLDYVGLAIYAIAGVLAVLCITYRCTHTDTDCWLAQDPIVCQKIKDGAK